jgi:hypothetical protein
LRKRGEFVIETAVAIAAGVVIVLGFVALAAHLSNRSWSDDEYERERTGGTAIGNAVLATQAIFEPGAQHVLEQRTADEADDVESGGPPDPGDRERT